MCQFFSLISDGKGKAYYFDAKVRKQILMGKIDYMLDSHTSIADYFGFTSKKEDEVNKYEYNPLLKKFQIELHTTDDSKQIKKFCKKLDFKTIVPELIIKPIVHPFQRDRKSVTPRDIELLKKWASIEDSVWASAEDLIWDSVGDSVGILVRASIRDSTWNPIWNSIENSIGDSIQDSIKDLIWNSVWDSVGAYTFSFFKFPRKKNPFQSCIDLWEKGLLPSFDGETWRLHGGKKGKILWESKLNEQ